MVIDPVFVRPTYDEMSFTTIPRSSSGLLGRGGRVALPAQLVRNLSIPYDAVVVLLADGFGWRFFEKYADGYPVLRRILDSGAVVKLTAQFPSTTAAHVTCLHSGLEVGQSGVYEWQYYEPSLDAIITPLLFSFAGTTERDQLKSTRVDPRTLYPTRTLYPGLTAAGVTSYILQHREYTPSTYSDVMFEGANVVPYRTLAEALVNLRLLLARRAGPAYFVLYFDRLDSICHEYGPNSPQCEAEVDGFLTALERIFFTRMTSEWGRVLCLVVADHGQVEVDPATTVYLNTDRRFAGIERFLKTNRRAEILAPAGSCRDFFLYVKDGLVDAAQAFLAQRLAGKAAVYRVADLIAAGFFGCEPPSPAFLARVGNLVILPYRGEAVWWYERDRFEQKFYGHHGGLTPQEMEIPLLAYAI